MKIREYIQVKPAGGADPDPAVYCPANGYIPDPEIYHPPVPLPETPSNSVMFVCNAATAHWRCSTYNYKFVRGGSAGIFTYNLYDNTGELIDTWTTNADRMDFDFPTSVGYYVVVVSVPAGTTITVWYNNDGTPPIHDDCIEAVIFNCPQLGGYTIKGNSKATSVQCQPNTTSVINSLAHAFMSCANYNYCDIDWSTMGSLTTMYSMFTNSGLLKIDMSALNAPNMTLADSIFSGCKYLTEVIMPATWYATRYYSMFANTSRMRKIVMPTTWSPSGTPDTSLSGFFQNCGVEGEIELPSMSHITNVQSMFSNCPNITIIRFKGNWSGISAVSGFISNVPLLETLEAPRIVKSTAAVLIGFETTMVSLKYYIGPDVGYMGMPINANLISITGEHDTSGFASHPGVTIPYVAKSTVTTVQMVKLRVNQLICGNNLTYKFTALTAIEIDWANSSFTGSAPQIILTAALNAAELNRIMTALPTMAKTMDIGNCDGYVTCDHTIATAKTWTVRGWCKLTTDAASSIAQTTAVCGGNISYGGGSSVTARGVCYATVQNPNIVAHSKVAMGTGEGAFSGTLISLVKNTTYYARAYATNTYGTAYGNQITFTTLP